MITCLFQHELNHLKEVKITHLKELPSRKNKLYRSAEQKGGGGVKKGGFNLCDMELILQEFYLSNPKVRYRDIEKFTMEALWTLCLPLRSQE